jgi:alkanesulfonate monooxygenase SsuD/methylene tetrahydromethanopterin reductase-like flavin-dependent oxidoreductase (luciferase family)
MFNCCTIIKAPIARTSPIEVCGRVKRPSRFVRARSGSRTFRDKFGHTPVSLKEKISWKCPRLVVGTGDCGSLPVMKQVKRTARRNEAAATGERGNTTSLVGAPEQVAEGMLEYYALGVTTFLTRGFDPLKDAIDYGRELIPIVRREIARREAGVHAHLAKRGGLSVRSQAYSPSP